MGAQCAPLRNIGPFLPVGADLCVRPKRTGRSPPHPSRPSAVPPSPEGEGLGRRGQALALHACIFRGARRLGARITVGASGRPRPTQKRLPPSRGKLSSEARLMRVPTGVMLLTSSPSSGPSGHLPPCGGKAKGRPSIPKFKQFVHRDLEGVGQMKNDIQRCR